MRRLFLKARAEIRQAQAALESNYFKLIGEEGRGIVAVFPSVSDTTECKPKTYLMNLA